MSEHAQSFITHLTGLKDRERGAFAHLKRSLGFDPGAYPPAYPYVERFVGADKHADDPYRKALYLTAGLFAFHPMHQIGTSLATALGIMAQRRKQQSKSENMERRFIALLGAEAESLPTMLRQSISLLAAEGISCDYADLLDDLARWFDRWKPEKLDQIRQDWARDFYRAYEPYTATNKEAETAADNTATEIEL
jgi:CRISPR system Cascade subunit CasB